mgnify:CR=1 FL=1
MGVTVIIPARYASTRFPGKPLAELCGKPMVQWVYERSSLCEAVDRVIVATDDQRIADAVSAFGVFQRLIKVAVLQGIAVGDKIQCFSVVIVNRQHRTAPH